jgi:hypothetical protein
MSLTFSTELMEQSNVAEGVVAAADLARVVEGDQERLPLLRERLRLCHLRSDPSPDLALEAARSCGDQEPDWCLKKIVSMYNSRKLWRVVQ